MDRTVTVADRPRCACSRRPACSTKRSGRAMQTETLYQDVARRITSMIDDGTLRAGERIPSVRKLHHNWQVSIATVLEAYRLLESRGVVEARPQSGYYVKSSARGSLPEPV